MNRTLIILLGALGSVGVFAGAISLWHQIEYRRRAAPVSDVAPPPSFHTSSMPDASAGMPMPEDGSQPGLAAGNPPPPSFAPPEMPPSAGPASGVSQPSSPPVPAGPPAAAGVASVAAGGSPLAAGLNAPDGDGQYDVQTLNALIREYFRSLDGRPGPSIANDVDLARILTGQNPMQIVLIPPGNPAISPDGHLRDRWGTPYYIRLMGNGLFEVRSAGPDRKLFTNDDLVDPAPGSQDSVPAPQREGI